jgi:hypothetical protein
VSFQCLFYVFCNFHASLVILTIGRRSQSSLNTESRSSIVFSQILFESVISRILDFEYRLSLPNFCPCRVMITVVIVIYFIFEIRHSRCILSYFFSVVHSFANSIEGQGICPNLSARLKKVDGFLSYSHKILWASLRFSHVFFRHRVKTHYNLVAAVDIRYNDAVKRSINTDLTVTKHRFMR